jgi:hypothetical protein
MKQNETKKDAKVAPNYNCKSCYYYTCRKSSFDKHLQTQKHIECTSETQLKTKSCNYFTCNVCNINFNSRTTLWRHQKKCKVTEKNIEYSEENKTIETNDIKNPETFQPQQQLINESLIIEFIKQNQEFQKQLLEVMKENIGTHTTNNTTNNTKFNLQFFLNEKCKDAFNITDFISNINVGFKDFENFGKLGYVGSINNILIRELKEIDVYKRPIHCSDLKREIIHIKDNNTWVKDEDKKHMKRAIKLIEHKNIKLVPEWLKANPKADDISTKKHEEYMKILNNSMGEMKDEDNERNYEKIIRNVAKEILIDKEK